MTRGRLLSRYQGSLSIVCKECNAGMDERCKDLSRLGNRLITNSGIPLIHNERANDWKLRLKKTTKKRKYIGPRI